MKIVWSIALALSTGLALAETPAEKTTIELLLAKEQYNNTIRTVEQQTDYASNPHWQELHAQALMGQQKNEDAAALLEKAIGQFPQNADLHQVAAMNNFSLAQQASIFSAPGYAKDGAAKLRKAIELAPDKTIFKLNLIGFYLQAPGIAGGDEKAGRQLAADLAKSDAVGGAIASSMVLSHDEKITEAIQAIDAQLTANPENARLLAQKASLLRMNKQEAAALPLYQQAAAHAEKPGSRHQYLYQVGRIAANTKQEISVGKEALLQVIEFYKDGEGQTAHLARVKLAQIYLDENNTAAAEQQLQPVLALKEPSERLENELKAVQKQLKKLTKKTS